MNSNKLKGRMTEKEITQKSMSRKLGITVQTLNAKINGKSQFTLDEVVNMTSILNIGDPREIFFAQSVPNTQQENELNRLK